MTILMVRHGETDWNVEKRMQGKTDTELNKKGIEQAKEISQKLKNEKIDLIICSPLKRAKQTAEIINKEIHCPIIYEEGLSERDGGEFEGKKMDEFDSKTFFSYEKNMKYEKAENVRDFRERVYQTLDNIIHQYPEKNILLVSHGGVSIAVCCYFNGSLDRDHLILHNCEVAKYSDTRRKI